MRVSRQIIDSLKPTNLQQLREKNKLESALKRAERTCQYVDSVVDKIHTSDNKKDVDGDPRENFVLTSRGVSYYTPDQNWDLSYGYKEEVVADFTDGQRSVHAKADSKSISLVETAGGNDVVYRSNDSTPTKVVKHVDGDGELSYEIFEGAIRIGVNDLFGI